MDTLDYTGPDVNEGSKGVWLGLGDPVRELPREFRPSAAAGRRHATCASSAGGCLVVGGPPYAERARTPRRASPRTRRSRGWPLVVLTDEPERAAAQRR